MTSPYLRKLAASLSAGMLVFAAAAAAQTGEPRASQTRPQAAENGKDRQKQADRLTEAAKAIAGPAGNPECYWIGTRMVGLLYNDDLDTAFRHLDLYDRFGCPGGHIQMTFRCLVRQNPELKGSETIGSRVHDCWLNPALQPSAAVATPGQPPTTNR